jgi:hypothetical protein
MAGSGSATGSGSSAGPVLLATLATALLLAAAWRGRRVRLEHTAGASVALCPAAQPG